MEPLHVKYRPTSWDQVIGQPEVIRSLRANVEAQRSRAFLFHGPSGTGKTTLARLCAAALSCSDVVEVDAATHTGVDAMREVAAKAGFRPLDGGARAFIIDECHRLSKQAWESLLKDIEEPPEGVYWFLCTTEPNKVPPTIQTRCASYSLNAVPNRTIDALVRRVAEREGYSIPDDVIEEIVDDAWGSPRQALVSLTKCVDAASRDEARRLLMRAPTDVGAIDLARALVPLRPSDAVAIVGKLKDEHPESVRLVVFHYALTAALGGNDWANYVLSEFERPAIESNKIGDILLRVKRLCWRKANGRS